MPPKARTSKSKTAEEKVATEFEKLLEIVDDSDDEIASKGKKDGNKSKSNVSGEENTGRVTTEVTGTSTSFKDFMLQPNLMRALQENSFEAPSIIQQEAIPAGIMGNDLLCQAQSGSGKTCVFVLTVLHQLKVKPGCIQCICVAPTRELAYQIKGEFVRFSKYIEGVTVNCFTGGFPEAKDRKVLEVDPPTIVVGTPGRLESLLFRPTVRRGESDACLDTSNVEYFIIDECDQIVKDEKTRRDVAILHAGIWGGLSTLDMKSGRKGIMIKPNVNSINSAKIVENGVKTLSRKIQTMMFSATMDEETMKLTRNLYPEVNSNDSSTSTEDEKKDGEEAQSTSKPLNVYTARKEIFIDNPEKQLLSGIIQRVINVLEKNKNAVLGSLLETLEFTQLVIFVSTHERAEKLSYILNNNGYKSICTHANLSQQEREERCSKFRQMEYKILVATDLLHRGIDIPNVNAVINYDMPENPDIYLHRIGRAGRFSTYGLAITFCTPETKEEIADREKREKGKTESTPDTIKTPVAENNGRTTRPKYVKKTNVEIFEDIHRHFAKPIPELVIKDALDPNLKKLAELTPDALASLQGWKKQKEGKN